MTVVTVHIGNINIVDNLDIKVVWMDLEVFITMRPDLEKQRLRLVRQPNTDLFSLRPCPQLTIACKFCYENMKMH